MESHSGGYQEGIVDRRGATIEEKAASRSLLPVNTTGKNILEHSTRWEKWMMPIVKAARVNINQI